MVRLEVIFALRYIMAITLTFYTNQISGQSTDQSAFHILYDVSGSMPKGDEYSNATKIAKTINDLSIRNSRLHIYFMGNKETLSNSFSISLPVAKDSLDSLDKRIKLVENQRSKVLYTDIKSGLESVVDTLNQYSENIRSAVIIVSDGLLSFPEDYPYKDSAGIEVPRKKEVPEDNDFKIKYNDETQKLIDSLKRDEKLVYFIQNGYTDKIYFFDIHYETQNYKDYQNGLIRNGRTHFYVNNEVNFENDSIANRELKKFINKVYKKMFVIVPQGQAGALLLFDELIAISNFKKIDEKDLKETRNAIIHIYENFDQYSVKLKYIADNQNLIYTLILEDSTLYSPKIVGSLLKFVKYFKDEDYITVGDTNKIILNRHDIDRLNRYITLLSIPEIKEALFKDIREIVRAMVKDNKSSRSLNFLLTDSFIPNAGELLPITNSLERKEDGLNIKETIILGVADYLKGRIEKELIYIYYDLLHEELFKLNSFVRDTMLYHTSTLLEGMKPKQDMAQLLDLNIILLKEAYTKDIENLPMQMVKHPKIRSNEALLCFTYVLGMFEKIYRSSSLEESIASLHTIYNDINARNPEIINVSEAERGILFLSKFFEFLIDHNIVQRFEDYDNNFDRALLVATAGFFAGKYLEVEKVEITDNLKQDILNVFRQYTIIREEIKIINEELIDLKGSFSLNDYQKYVHQKVTSILIKTSEILILGIKFGEYFAENPEEFRNKYAKYVRETRSLIEAYFQIEEKKYTRAAALMIPVLADYAFKVNTDSLFFERRLTKQRIRRFIDKSAIVRIKKSMNEHEDILTDSTHFISYEQVTEYTALHELKILNPLIDSVYISKIVYYQFKDFLNFLETQEGNNKLKKLFTKSASKFSSIKIEDQKDIVYKLSQSDAFNHNLIKFIQLASEVSTAVSAKDVSTLLSNYAMPPASYRIKRKELTSLSVNAFVGGGASYNVNSAHIAPILFSPIGIDLAKNHFPTTKKVNINHKTSWSIFISILDLGNIFVFDIDDSEDEDLKINLERVISPGAFFTISPFQKLPVTFGVGWQGYPNRISIFTAFDLPIYRLK